ncbi:acid protease [Mycena galericulata]|nr:acid protease [Mycena galericulata]
MLPLSFALCVLLTSSSASASSRVHTVTRHITAHSRNSDLDGRLLPPALFEAPLIARVPRRASRVHALNALRSLSSDNSGGEYTTPLMGADYDFEYLVPITIGGQNFSVIVDTGSSDTWLPKTGFACFNLTGHPESASTCAFGSPGFDPARSKSFVPFPNTEFKIMYGDGEYLSGVAAYETVGVGGCVVTHQEIGLVTSAAWVGDGINTGLLGLAYPLLTSVSNASTGSGANGHGAQMPYDPWFFSAVKQGRVREPYFSLALNRPSSPSPGPGPDAHLGVLALGGLPSGVGVTNVRVTLPVQGYSVATGTRTRVDVGNSNGAGAVNANHDADENANTSYRYFALPIQAYTFPGYTFPGSGGTDGVTILDSGTTLSMLPSPVAQAYNRAWGATWKGGVWWVDCGSANPDSSSTSTNRTQGRKHGLKRERKDKNGKRNANPPPPFSVQIANKTFTVDARDLVVYVGTGTDGAALCASGIQDGGPGGSGSVFILGDVFLHNVVATFDIQRNEVTITQRERYQ